jgi:hypothetical protein
MQDNNEHVKILQFNQMKGVQQGKIDNKNGEVYFSGQKPEQMPGRYLIAEVDPAGKIIKWK